MGEQIFGQTSKPTVTYSVQQGTTVRQQQKNFLVNLGMNRTSLHSVISFIHISNIHDLTISSHQILLPERVDDDAE